MSEILVFDITLLYGVFFLSIDILLGFEFYFVTLAIEVLPKVLIPVWLAPLAKLYVNFLI